MSKKILAMLMAVAMAFSLLPVTAFAVGEENGQAPVTKKASENNLTMNKTVTPEGDGTYTVQLESYATGSVTPTQAPVPMDFVLVLDVSGSMKDEIASYTYQATDKTSWSVSDVYNDYYQKDKLGIPHRTDVTYYAKIDDEYYPVFYKQKRVSQGVFKGYYEYWLEANNKPLGPRVTDSTWKKEVYNGALYIRKTDSKEKLEAMKTAVNHFIDSVAAQRNGETPVAHRISIVKFAGKSNDGVGNDTYPEDGFTYNYTQKVTELTDVTAAGSVASLKRDVNALTAGGATRADLGMEKADGVLNGRQDAEKDRPSVVIMFTDGKPTTSDGFEWNVAGAAVDTAKTLKNSGTKVYTIGMFTDADPSDTNGAFNKYMNGVSSNYPNAVGTKKNNKKDYNGIYLGTPAGDNYYFKADNAGALDQVFQKISHVTTTTSPLDASAVVVDNVPSNFALNEDSVTVYTADCTGKNSEGELTWKDTLEKSNIIPNIPEDKNDDGSQTISTTGFDFSKNWCGLDENNQACGQKLIIEFTIKRTNYGGTQPTNAGAYIKAKEADEKPIISLKDPQVPVTIELNKTLGVNDEKTYDGKGFAILTKIAAQADTLANGTNNAYVDMKLTVKVDDTTTYTYKIPAGAKTGSWYQGDSADPMTPKQIADVTTPKDVRRESNKVKPYTYTFDLKLSDANPKGAESGAKSKKYENNTASFKITPRDVTVTAKDESVVAGQSAPTYTAEVTGTIGQEKVKYDISCAYDPATSTEGTFDIEPTGEDTQGNYNVTYEKGTLTVTNTKNATVKLSDLIKKELTVKDGSTLPDNTKFTVTVTPKNGGTQDAIIGTTTSQWTGGIEAEGNTTYTVPFDFKTKNTLSLPAGTHTYTVQETEGDVSGVEYDPTTYLLKIEAKMDGTYSASYTVAPTGDATEATPEEKATPLTIKNTYQTPNLSVTKQTVSVDGKAFDSNPVAHVGNQIIWSVTVTNKNSTPAQVTLTDAMAEGVYTDNECKTQAENVNWDADTHSWTATVSGEKTYYVNYTVKEADIPKGKIVNTIVMNNGDKDSASVSTWDTKQLKSATKLDTSDWTTTVTLELPTVKPTEQQPATQEREEVKPAPIAVKSGSYVIDQIGNEFTFVPELTLKVGDKTYNGTESTSDANGTTYTFGSTEYKVTYTAKKGDTPAQFTWNINENVYAGTKVTLSYKLKLTTPNTKTGTYGVEDLKGNGQIEEGKTPIYTNEKAALYIKENNQEKEIAVFPKPSVSYTVKGSSGSHSGGSRPSLNTKDHYGYIIGYPVDYYTGQPTTDQTKKPVRPEGKITRAEVATIYFRMLTDESRTKFWSQSSGYSDVKTGDWFNNAVSTLSNAGIIAGYEDGSFRPNGYITRAEFATIAARFFDVTYNGKDLFPDISGHWAKDYINQAANKGFVNGYEDGTFKPDRNITRAEAVTLVNRTLDRHPDKNHFTKDMLVWPDNMDQTKWYYADMQEATNSHTYQMKENSDKTKYENWTKTLPIRNWEALEKAWSNANSSQGNGNVV